jgi:hypothetical protein
VDAFRVELIVKKLMFSSLTLMELTVNELKLPREAKRYPVLIEDAFSDELIVRELKLPREAKRFVVLIVDAFRVELIVKKLMFSSLTLMELTVNELKLPADAKR